MSYILADLGWVYFSVKALISDVNSFVFTVYKVKTTLPHFNKIICQ